MHAVPDVKTWMADSLRSGPVERDVEQVKTIAIISSKAVCYRV